MTPPTDTVRKPVSVVAVHMDLGAGRRGVDMGPSRDPRRGPRRADDPPRLRRGGLRRRCFVHEPEVCPIGEEHAKYLHEVLSCCVELRDRALVALDAGSIPLVLGGDHSIAIGSIAAQALWHRRRGQEIGVVWVDAHADMNTPQSSPSGNIHGMPLAVCLGQGAPELVALAGERPALDARHVAIVGARDLDASEREVVRRSGVRVFTMSEIDERGIATCMDEAIARASGGTAGDPPLVRPRRRRPAVRAGRRDPGRRRAHLPRGAPRVREGRD